MIVTQSLTNTKSIIKTVYRQAIIIAVHVARNNKKQSVRKFKHWHTLLTRPATKLDSEIMHTHSTDEDAVNWLTTYGS